MKGRALIMLLAVLASILVPIMIGNVYASGCTTSCQVTANSNVPSADGTVWIQIDNNTGPYCTSNPCTVALPQASPPTFNFANNSIHTLSVLNSSFTGPSSGGHYVWKYWANNYASPCSSPCIPCPGPGTIGSFVCPTPQMLRIGPLLYNYTGTSGFTAVFDKQYAATFSFIDASRNSLSIVPTNVTLQAQGSSPVTIFPSYTGQYISANRYTVMFAFWEGVRMDLTGSPQPIDLTNGPSSATVSLKAYPAIIQVIDNNNNPVQGANVTITFVNGTSRGYISNNGGLVNLGDIPVGSFGATVRFQNQAYGPFSLSAVGNPTNTIQVNAGSSPTGATTTAIVLLAIFGIAFFLILLAIKVRKPAPPPSI